MGGCFTGIFVIAAFVLVVISLIRWFEQTIEAVDARAWGRVMTLVMMPFAVWLFPSRISAGRPSPFPLHEPVRGFGSMPLKPPPPPTESPKPPPTKRKSAIDPEQIAKLKEKMRQQGMLPPEE